MCSVQCVWESGGHQRYPQVCRGGGGGAGNFDHCENETLHAAEKLCYPYIDQLNSSTKSNFELCVVGCTWWMCELCNKVWNLHYRTL